MLIVRPRDAVRCLLARASPARRLPNKASWSCRRRQTANGTPRAFLLPVVDSLRRSRALGSCIVNTAVGSPNRATTRPFSYEPVCLADLSRTVEDTGRIRHDMIPVPVISSSVASSCPSRVQQNASAELLARPPPQAQLRTPGFPATIVANDDYFSLFDTQSASCRFKRGHFSETFLMSMMPICTLDLA